MKNAVLFAVLAFTVYAAEAATVAVDPRSLYEVSFKARVVSGLSFEDNPQLVDLMPLYVSRPSAAEEAALNSVNWRFLDKDGKRIKRAWQGGAGITLFSREWRRFRFRVYVPDNACSLNLDANSNRKGNRAEVSDLSVKTVPRGRVVNPNPDFSESDICVPGWQLVSAARLSTSSEARTHVELTGGSICSDPFPLVPGRKMILSVRGSNSRDPVSNRDMRCSLRYFASYGDTAVVSKHKRSSVVLKFKSKTEEKSLEFIVPKGVHWARIFASGGVLERAEVCESDTLRR